MTDALLAQRQTGIGSTDASIIMGSYPWKTPLELYLEKIGESEKDEGNDEGNEGHDSSGNGSQFDPMGWGTALEAIVAKRWAKITGATIVDAGSRFRRSKANPWQLCHLDRLVADKHGQERILEIKTAGHWSQEHWEDDGCPIWYLAQVQHQMAVTGMARGTIACLIAGQRLVWREIVRDDDFISEMTEREGLFWSDVQERRPPKAIAGDLDALAKRFPETTIGKRVDLPIEATEIFEGWEDLKSVVKNAKNAIDAHKARIRQMMGDAEFGTLANESGAFTLRQQTRKEHLVNESTSRPLRHTRKT